MGFTITSAIIDIRSLDYYTWSPLARLLRAFTKKRNINRNSRIIKTSKHNIALKHKHSMFWVAPNHGPHKVRYE